MLSILKLASGHKHNYMKQRFVHVFSTKAVWNVYMADPHRFNGPQKFKNDF